MFTFDVLISVSKKDFSYFLQSAAWRWKFSVKMCSKIEELNGAMGVKSEIYRGNANTHLEFLLEALKRISALNPNEHTLIQPQDTVISRCTPSPTHFFPFERRTNEAKTLLNIKSSLCTLKTCYLHCKECLIWYIKVANIKTKNNEKNKQMCGNK